MKHKIITSSIMMILLLTLLLTNVSAILITGSWFPDTPHNSNAVPTTPTTTTPTTTPSATQISDACLRAFADDTSPRALRMLNNDQLTALGKQNPTLLSNPEFVSEFDDRLPGHPEMLNSLSPSALSNWGNMHGLSIDGNPTFNVIDSNGRITFGGEKETSFLPTEFAGSQLSENGLKYDDVTFTGTLDKIEYNNLETITVKDTGSVAIPDKWSGSRGIAVEEEGIVTIGGNLLDESKPYETIAISSIPQTDKALYTYITPKNSDVATTLTGSATATLNKPGFLLASYYSDGSPATTIMTSDDRPYPIIWQGAVEITPDHLPSSTNMNFQPGSLQTIPTEDGLSRIFYSKETNFREANSLLNSNPKTSFVDFDDDKKIITVRSDDAVSVELPTTAMSELRFVKATGASVADIGNSRVIYDNGKVRLQGRIQDELSYTRVSFESDTINLNSQIFGTLDFPKSAFNWQSAVGQSYIACSDYYCLTQIEAGSLS